MGVLKELYFEMMEGEKMRRTGTYLANLIEFSGIDDEKYSFVMDDLYRKEFYSLVDFDENREKDGLEIREELDGDIVGPPRLLEVMLGICKRMDFNLCDSGGDRIPIKDSFWEIFCNLGLDKFENDGFLLDWTPANLEKILQNLLRRKYKKNGKGGFFPVKRCKKDQREIEIWYQMQQYLIENYPI